jgi:DNA polymerase
MQANADKLRKLHAMGLGPVWQRRGLLEQAVPTSTAGADEAIAAMDWDGLNEAITHCTRCRLCKGRTHAVPGAGARNASWLFIGEGPGHDEDVQGEPFAGPAGKLLDNMLGALTLTRAADVFIANVVKCRPVGPDGQDRPPAADEITACLPYLKRQIALIEPTVIVALGKTAATALLERDDKTALADLRETPHRVGELPVVVTYHPAYLLRKPADKAKSWRDLCLARSLVDGR